jgi:hypothetical protein
MLWPLRGGSTLGTTGPEPDLAVKPSDASGHPTGVRAWGRSWDRSRTLRMTGLGVAAVALFFAYLRMSRSEPMNADGAGNAVQAWDMLHGNLLLHHWTVSDVPFYTTELIQYALIEGVYGYRADVVHVAAAMTYTLLVLLAIGLARGRATGANALARMAITALVIAVPMPGEGYHVLLLLPNHTGTGVPVLVTWLILDRALSRDRAPAASYWLPVTMIALLTWGQLGDPLVVFVAVLPLMLVCLWRAVRLRAWSGLDARLALAGLASIAATQLVLLAIRTAGGFAVHPPVAEFSPFAQWQEHLPIVRDSIEVIFHAKLSAENTAVGGLFAVLHLAVLAGVGLAVVIAATQVLQLRRGRRGDLVAQLAATGILVNIGAYVVSTHGGDPTSTRQAAVVLPLGAVLAGRVLGPLLTSTNGRVREFRVRWLAGPLAVLVVLFAGQTVVQTRIAPVPGEHQDVADWLVAHQLTYGLGSYWSANNITLASQGRVTVAPITGSNRIFAYRWETRSDWYDPVIHDARFIVIESIRPGYGTVQGVLAQFGDPAERVDFPEAVLLRYDFNLLTDLAAYCIPEVAARITECPALSPIPGR